VRVAKELYHAMMRTHPGAAGIVVEHHSTTTLELREHTVARWLRPGKPEGRLSVMVADDQAFPAVQPFEDLQEMLGMGSVGEVAEMVDVILRADDCVPPRDQNLVHVGNGTERSAAHADDGFMPKVGVGREEDGQESTTAGSGSPHSGRSAFARVPGCCFRHFEIQDQVRSEVGTLQRVHDDTRSTVGRVQGAVDMAGDPEVGLELTR
jgi:hypothetical protein